MKNMKKFFSKILEGTMDGFVKLEVVLFIDGATISIIPLMLLDVELFNCFKGPFPPNVVSSTPNSDIKSKYSLFKVTSSDV